MKIRSIKISKQLDKSLYDYAQAKGLSGSAVVREALGEYLAGASQRSKSEPLSVAAFAADLAGCASGPADLSTGAAHMEGYGRSRAEIDAALKAVTRDVIVDTGPLVAFLNHRDTWHRWALEQFAAIQPPLLTCESVVSEAAFLLSRDHAGVDGLLQMVERRIVQLDFDLNDEMPHVRRLMKRYANVPMSLADASLVRMTEVATKATVITLDDDFRVYRRLGRQVIPLIAPSTRRRPQR